MTTLDEHLLQLLNGGGVFYGINLCTRHHTVAYLRLREVQRILEDLHFLTDLILAVGIVDTGLYQIVEVDFRKFFLLVLTAHPDTDHA